jgi:hypothetical protein
MKIVSIAVALAFASLFTSTPLTTADDSDAIAVDADTKAALEALGASVETDDKQRTTTVRFTKPNLRAALVHLKKLSRVEGVGLQNSAVTGDDLALLKELPGLKKLWLDSEQLSASGTAALGELPQLENLFLMGSGVTDETVKSLQRLRKLNSLQLASTRVTIAGFQNLAGIPELVSFGVSNLDWERSHPDEPQFSDECISALRSAPRLKSLLLGFGTRISDDGLKQLLLSLT